MSVNQVFDAIDPYAYYSRILGPLPKEDSSGNVKVRCVFPPHEDPEGSLSINVRSRGGLFKCFGCGTVGNMIQFHMRYNDISDMRVAITQMLEMFDVDVKKLTMEFLDEEQADTYARFLFDEPQEITIQYLIQHRGISLDVIKQFKLGLEPKTFRLTIPIRDAANNILNFKRHLLKFRRKTPADEATKGISVAGRGANVLYPIENLRANEIVMAEGELDSLLLITHGFNAISSTNGANAFDPKWARMFRDKDVILMLDNDMAGHNAADKRREMLYPYAGLIKEVYLDQQINGKDITDYWEDEPQTFKLRVLSAIETAVPFIKQNPIEKAAEVNLYQAARSDLVNKRIIVRALVAGKEDRPLGIPKMVKISCDKPVPGCNNCPFITSDGSEDYPLDIRHPDFVKLLTSPTKEHEAAICKMLGLTCFGAVKSGRTMEIINVRNVEEVNLIPQINMSDDKVQYTIRAAYAEGYGLDQNELYDFTGTTVIDPRNNYVTHIFDHVTKINKISEEVHGTEQADCDGVVRPVYEHLAIFQPSRPDLLYQKLNDIYNDLQVNVTRIVNRNDILRAVDLLYLSPITFVFDEEPIVKGWMDVLILGDTACGKSKTVERLRDHYCAGEIYSGEGISKVGITGGYINISGNGKPRFMLGVWPLNDGRLVFIDELSGMSKELLSELTMLRDHGVAESTKQAQRAKHPARVRFGMISNPRGDKKLADYPFGIEAVRHLVGADADISRFDMVVVAAGGEVTSEEIHAERIAIPHIYTSDLCNLLVRWAWSRRPGQIKFTDNAILAAKRIAVEMGKKYSPMIPLVLGQSQRIKLARIGIAIATRVFSTPDGETLIVDEEHIEAAKRFLYEAYDKPSCGYYQFSLVERRKQELPSVELVKEFLDAQPYMLTECLLMNKEFTKRSIEDNTGYIGSELTIVMQTLLKLRIIISSYSKYVLSQGAIDFLVSYKHPGNDNYYKPPEGTTDVAI